MSDYPPSSDPWSGGDAAIGPPLASWGLRVGAALIDGLIGFAIYGVCLALGSDVLGSLASFAFAMYNAVRQGQSGQTIGKGVLKIRLVRLDGVNPPGIGLSIGRYFLHIVDALPCLLGYLWPLWDKKRQTFTDKILNTVVVTA